MFMLVLKGPCGSLVVRTEAGEEVEPVSGRAKRVIVKSLEPCPQTGLVLA